MPLSNHGSLPFELFVFFAIGSFDLEEEAGCLRMVRQVKVTGREQTAKEGDPEDYMR